MNGSDLDAMLEGFTDAQIKACLARRAASREEKRRTQTAARMNALRARNRDAHSDAPVTQPVTQQNGSSQSGSDAASDAPVTAGVTPTVTRTVTQTGEEAPPMVSPCPPILSPPSHASPPTHVRPPTVEEVLTFLASATLPIPVEDRPEFAQAYVDARERTDPPWHLPDTDRKRGGPINLSPAGWQADCRTFARNWRDNVAERASRQRFSLSAATPEPFRLRQSSTSKPPAARTYTDAKL